MGNTQQGQRKGSKHAVTVLQSDGRVLEFSRSLRVADLLVQHPKHFVCHSSSLVLLQQGKMLSPNTVLMKGEVYFLLPLPSSKAGHVQAKETGEDVQRSEKKGGTMRLLITKQQLAKILADGSVKVEPKLAEQSLSFKSGLNTQSTFVSSNNGPGLRVLHRPSPSMVKRSVTWSPGLESISEVPVM